ncbi:MAG: peptidase M23, partial [Pyrinomonadaceae bacterium]
YRPAAGQWHILNSSNGTYFAWQFGNATDLPTPGDYDGDGRADFAIFRPSDGNWWIRRSSSTATTVQTFGLNGDRPGPNAFVY